MSPIEMVEHPLAHAVTQALLHFLWQGTAIAFSLAALIDLLGVRRSNWRYNCSVAALLFMAACPLFTIGWLSQSSASSAIPANEVADAVAVSSVNGSVSAAPGNGPFRWSQQYILAAWAIGVFFFGGRLLLGIVGVRRLRRTCFELPADLIDRVECLSSRFGMPAQSMVYLSCRVGQAMAIGIVRPIVLIPAAWATEMPMLVLEAVVAHELAHLRRWDIAVNILQRFVEALLFYHPAVWWLSRRIRVEREFCCDELAVTVTGRRLEYVEALEIVARSAAYVEPLFAASIRGEKEMPILQRVRNVLGVSLSNEHARIWPAGLLAMLLPLGGWVATAGLVSAEPAAVRAGQDDKDEMQDRIRSDRDEDDEDEERESRRHQEEDRDEAKEKKQDRDAKRDESRQVEFLLKTQKRQSEEDADDGPVILESDGRQAIIWSKKGSQFSRRNVDQEELRAAELKAMVDKLMAENKRLRVELDELRAAQKHDGTSYEEMVRRHVELPKIKSGAKDQDDREQSTSFIRKRKVNETAAESDSEVIETKIKDAMARELEAMLRQRQSAEAMKQKMLAEFALKKQEDALRSDKLLELRKQKESAERRVKEKLDAAETKEEAINEKLNRTKQPKTQTLKEKLRLQGTDDQNEKEAEAAREAIESQESSAAQEVMAAKKAKSALQATMARDAELRALKEKERALSRELRALQEKQSALEKVQTAVDKKSTDKDDKE